MLFIVHTHTSMFLPYTNVVAEYAPKDEIVLGIDEERVKQMGSTRIITNGWHIVLFRGCLRTVHKNKLQVICA